MKDNLPRYTLRIRQSLLDKLEYIAESEGRSKNKEITQLIKARIRTYENEHGPIPLEYEHTDDEGMIG